MERGKGCSVNYPNFNVGHLSPVSGGEECLQIKIGLQFTKLTDYIYKRDHK